MNMNPTPQQPDARLNDQMGIVRTQMMGDAGNNPTHPDYHKLAHKFAFRHCFSVPLYFLGALILHAAYRGFPQEDLITGMLVVISGFLLGLVVDWITFMVKKKRKT